MRDHTQSNSPTTNELVRHTHTNPTPDTISVNPRVRTPLENDIVRTSKRRANKKHMHHQGLNTQVNNAEAKLDQHNIPNPNPEMLMPQ